MAAFVYRGSQRRSIIAFWAMIVLLTVLASSAHRVFISPSLVYGVGSLVVICCTYYALRGL